MELWHSIILGIVEGVTEFLPISSTGHLILTSAVLGIPQTEFVKSFEVIIQLGAIGAVIALYWKRLRNIALLKKLFVAFLPTAVIGALLYPIIKTYLLGSSVVLWALLLGGIALILFEKLHTERAGALDTAEHISYKQALGIGLFQTIAVVPGVSRAASTIIGGLLLGLKRTAIVEFSFLLAVPTMIAASALDLFQSYHTFTADMFGVLAVGFCVSFVVALGAITFLLKYIKTHTFTPFGVYRIVLALLFFFILW